MTRASAGRSAVLFALALLSAIAVSGPGNVPWGVPWGAASAASIDSAYDMDRLLNEPHPLANQMGTRWQPAPVRPSAPMLVTPVAIPPAVMLPVPPPSAPATVPAPSATPAITPHLNIDETGAPPVQAPPPSTPPTAQARPAPAPPPPAPPTQAQPTQAQPAPPSGAAHPAEGGVSIYRVGGHGAPVGGHGAPTGPQGLGFLSEVRIGALAHDEGPFSHNKEDGAAGNFEVLFTSPDFLKYIWSPRPHLGFDVTTNGSTNDAYFGLSYEWPFWRYMFGGFSLGGAVHDGYNKDAPPDRKELGCHLLFRESIEIGFRFAERHSISGFLDHISNAKICSKNEGLENAGVRYGYKF